jgi:hypothetical protein
MSDFFKIPRGFAASKRTGNLEFYLVALAGLVGIIHPLHYWSVFSGDAQIHLVYARNILRGYPLQFNLHETNSGETSMGFMFVDALIMWIVGAALTPLIIKFLCLASLYLTALATWLLAGELSVQRPWREIAAVLTLWLPGSVFSSMAGSENGLFAALSCVFTYYAIRSNWYDVVEHPTLIRDSVAALLASILFWLRPETAPLMLILLGTRIVGATWFAKRLRREFLQCALFLTVFCTAIASYFWVFFHYAHEMPYGAGRVRLLLSRYVDSFWLGPIPIDGKVLLRIASYFSVVVPALVISALAMRDYFPDRALRLKIVAFAGIFFGFLAAYVLNLLPAVHFARYSTFIWPFGLVLAALGLQVACQFPGIERSVRVGLVVVLGVAFAGTASYEIYLRRDMGRTGIGEETSLVAAEIAPERRERASVALAKAIGIPAGTAATLGYQEVQVRYYYTDNFVIRSLDGITDSRLLSYWCNGWIDHDGYLIDTQVDYLMEFVSYNGNRSVWSLRELTELGVGESLTRPGIIYKKIGTDIVKIERTVEKSSDRPGGTCAK